MSDFVGGLLVGGVLTALVLAIGASRSARHTGEPTTPPPPPGAFVKRDSTTVSYEPRPPGSRPPRPSDKPRAARGRPSTALIVRRNSDGTRQPIRGLD